jgi:hypothetical protein
LKWSIGSLTLVIVRRRRDTFYIRAAYLPVAAVVVASCGRGPPRVLLMPLFTALEALLSAADSDVRHCLLAAAEGHLPASLGRAKHDHLIAGGEDILCSQTLCAPVLLY